MWSAYPSWLNSGDNAWQLTAATLVGLMSVPGLVVLYGGVMQKRWSVNSMMMSFIAFALVLVCWVLFGFNMAFGRPIHILGAHTGFFANLVGRPADILSAAAEQGQAVIPLITTGPAFHFPTATLAYFQFVFAAITPILMLGSVLGRINFKAWIPFVVLWSSLIYTVNAFLIWGGGWWAQHGAVDYSGGYVIHLAAGVSGFVAAAVIGPRLQRDREVDAPNNLLMVATGAGLLWLGWNGFNGGDPYYAGADAAVAVLNTNLCTAVAFLVWIGWDYATRRKPSLIGSVNAMITGLVAITPAAGYVNGWGAMAIGFIGSTLVYFAYNYVSRLRPFRRVDDTLGVIYTHGFAGLAGGLLTGVFADPHIIVYPGIGKTPAISIAGLIHGHGVLLKWQAIAALWVILFSGIGTFILLKLVGLFVPLRMKEKDMEDGDLAVHGHEVYPSDVPSLGFPSGAPTGGPARPAEAPG
ncbi:MAG: ammonium transporter, Amt family [Solirubrobacteraceae bacterium]|nr:ammonium transporter, Amt family [Solirubrobacteraceae bacterium]MEA2397466.1 ammonium transporter, Amt family [Thermoleophilaceae bacterium]